MREIKDIHKKSNNSNPFRILLLIDFSESFGRDLIMGISEYSEKHNQWSLCRMPLQYKEKHGIEGVIKWARSWKADGIIAQVGRSSEIAKLKRTGIPFIVQDLANRDNDVTYISGEYKETGKIAATYFIERGYKNLAYYGFSNIYSSRERLEGFKKIASKHHLKVHSYLSSTSRDNDLWFYQQSPLIRWLNSLPKPAALFALDDNQALHVSEACRLASIDVPGQIAILGVDNDETICRMANPPLSSIALNSRQSGYETAKIMDQMIRKQQKGRNINVAPTHIITRQSSDITAIEDEIIKKTVNFIILNNTKKLTVIEILKHIPLSRRMLEKRFKSVLGITIQNFIHQKKIEYVSRLIADTQSSILEIAIQCGFSDSHNLSRLFSKYKGCTPFEFRQKIRNQE